MNCLKYLLVFIFLLNFCSKPKTPDSNYVPSWVEPAMKDWILQHSQQYKGWRHVKWSPDLLAQTTGITDTNTISAGEAAATKLNTAFTNTNGTAPSDEIGAYYNSGILVHGWDDYDNANNLFSPIKDNIPSSYLRADLNQKHNKSHLIWNDTFQIHNTGGPTAGIIYKNLDQLSGEYMANCVFPADAGSVGRFLGCNNHIQKIEERKMADFRQDVQKLWDDKKSMNICVLQGITDKNAYLKSFNQWLGLTCALSGNKNDFDMMMDVYKDFSSNAWSWNEVVLRFLPDRSSYFKTIAAIFYLHSPTDDYYIVPTGALQKYNIHLGMAQKQQTIAKQQFGTFIPIIQINMEEITNGKAGFHFYKEDQVETLN